MSLLVYTYHLLAFPLSRRLLNCRVILISCLKQEHLLQS